MAITQLSVFLMNQPGALIEAIQALSDAGINIRAMSIAEANDSAFSASSFPILTPPARFWGISIFSPRLKWLPP